MTELTEIRRKRFVRKRVRLDGHAYVECTFIECTLEYDGGDCRIEETFFPRPDLEMSGAAANTVEVLRVIGALNERMFLFPS